MGSIVSRFDAVDGTEVVRQARLSASGLNNHNNNNDQGWRIGMDVAWEWDTTQNSLWDKHVAPGQIRQLTPGEIGCALSHVSLWRELANAESDDDGGGDSADIAIAVGDGETQQDQPQQKHASQSSSLSMLIFEDDAEFLKQGRGKSTKHKKGHSVKGNRIRLSQQDPSGNPSGGDRFLKAFRKANEMLPREWDVFYLGFSDRGERRHIATSGGRTPTTDDELNDNADDDLVVQIFQPTYGFHTHAYAIHQSSAKRLLENLPVVGPVDVWLADNQWFGLNVYCAMVANEGWNNNGAPLVGQDRSISVASSVGHSSR